jgi:hypothetical protein
MRDVWVLTEALVSDASDVPPNDVLLEYLRRCSVFVPSDVRITWTSSEHDDRAARDVVSGRRAHRSLPYEGMGRNLFLRISEDK